MIGVCVRTFCITHTHTQQPSIIRSINNYRLHCGAHWFERLPNNGKGEIVINVAYQLLAGRRACYYAKWTVILGATQPSKIIDTDVAWSTGIFR